jgi:glucose-1-phosphate cytidylyltransferase
VRAVILAGGLGTRLREETEYRPKPMVEVGGRPILWHIMKSLSQQGLQEFIVCLGYKGDQIKDYFLNYDSRINDVTVSLGSQNVTVQHTNIHEEDWQVTLANTGQTTMTGGRILKIQQYVGKERFLCTYGDGLADIDLSALVKFHIGHEKLATVTAVHPTSRFGAMETDQNNQVKKFAEKPKLDQWINGGFFIFEPGIFEYLTEDCVLEAEPLESLARDGQLMAYHHEGFWQPMDTFRESQELNNLWNKNEAPWRNW